MSIRAESKYLLHTICVGIRQHLSDIVIFHHCPKSGRLYIE